MLRQESIEASLDQLEQVHRELVARVRAGRAETGRVVADALASYAFSPTEARNHVRAARGAEPVGASAELVEALCRDVEALLRFCEAQAPDHAPRGYVTADGAVRLSKQIMAHLKIPGGGGVIAIRRDGGRAELISDDTFVELLYGSEEAKSEG